MSDLFASSSAVLSDCGRYRYRLERSGPGEGKTVVLMVNPSTADADADDHTIRKLRGFGSRHQWGRIIVGNLFAYRATDVRQLGRICDPEGNPTNNLHLLRMCREADRIVVAWGPVTKQPKAHQSRWRGVVALIDKPMFSIGEPAKCGHPKHPLTLAYNLPLLPWAPPA